MTPDQIETAARQRYNAVGETFWSADEFRGMIYAAELELCTEVPSAFEQTYSASTVASQQEYAFPTVATTIKRITYNGAKLKNVNFREDDALTLLNQATTQTGTPQYYTQWNYTLALRPIPSDVGTLKIYAYVEPQPLTSSASVLELRTTYHMRLVNYLLSEMYAKDKDLAASGRYRQLWEQDKVRIRQAEKKRIRGDSFATVQDEESMPETFLGAV